MWNTYDIEAVAREEMWWILVIPPHGRKYKI
jgi:hypothetical protein